ncbi:type II secretion system F family protein [Leucobacter chromiiresistens]|uniref:Tight adherence protein B n=1 Tax=Leucobacter chromiiresistens TaxID=1079994 RepID=A0A1H0YVH4_9MICO|nr:type II secretion system F family protein [Leucobacter chromiiresistens]SDQ18846.1 tight adherence protein B [Leucobacter chromiiresistens]
MEARPVEWLRARLPRLAAATTAAEQRSEAAVVAERTAALLRGGVPAARAIALISADAPPASEVGIVGGRVADGVPVPSALAAAAEPEWRVLAVAWRLAEVCGAPLAPALQRIAESLRELDRMRERRSVLLAGPRATVRMVAALPILALLLGLLLGFDPVPVLVGPAGAVIAAVGAGLLGVGVQWSRLLQRRAAREDAIAGLPSELLWVALGGGAPPAVAMRIVVDHVDAFGAEWVPFVGFCSGSPLLATVAAAESAGVPMRPLLLEQAVAERVAAAARLEREAERLGVRVLLPLGVCVLPSFIVLGVLPVVLSMFGAA